MKVAIIGAAGNLGRKLVQQASERKYRVVGVMPHRKSFAERIEVIEKSLFDLTTDDLAGCDAVISAFGSGFRADPALNLQAYQKYADLADQGIRVIAIAGAGSLYQDETHTHYGYEAKGYPPVMKEISRYTRLGIDVLKPHQNWTVVCPAGIFDPDGKWTKQYRIGIDECQMPGKNGPGYTSYADLAEVMLDCAEKALYKNQVIVVASPIPESK